MNRSLHQLLLDELRLLLSPLQLPAGGAGSPDPENPAAPLLPGDHGWQPLFAALGWDLDALDGLSFAALSSQSVALNLSFDRFEQWATNPPDRWDVLRDALEVSDDILAAVRQLHAILADPPASWADLGEELITHLVISYLRARWPSFYALAVATALIDVPRTPLSAADWVVATNGRLVRRPILVPELRFDRIGQLLSDPFGTLKQFYLGGDTLADKAAAQRAADLLFPRIGTLFEALGAASHYSMKPDTYQLDYDPVTRELAARMLWVKFALPFDGGGFGAILALSAADQGNLGLVVTPTGDASFEQELDHWRLSFELTPGVQGFALGPGGPTLIAGPGDTTMRARLTAIYLPDDGAAALLVGSAVGSHLRIGQLSAGGEVSLDTAQNKQDYALTLGADAGALALGGLLTLSWDSLRWSAGRAQTSLALGNLRLQVDQFPDFALAGDLNLIFKDGVVQSASSIRLREPGLPELPLKGFHLDDTCFALTLSESNINRLLALISSDLADRSGPGTMEVTLRLIFGGPRKELRLDWDVGAAPRTYALPGLNVTVPEHTRLTVALSSAEGGTFNRLALTLPRGKALTAASTFAWGRDGERELQNDDGRPQDEPPLFELSLEATASADPDDQQVSLLLLELPLDGGAPKFLRQLAPLPVAGAEPCAPLDLAGAFKLRAEDWTGRLKLNLEQFKLPFLRNDLADKQQFIRLSLPTPAPTPGDPNPPPQSSFELSFGESAVKIPIAATVQLGTLAFATELTLIFNWETFGLKVDHDIGVQLVSDQETLAGGSFLNLGWDFKGALLKSGMNQGKYHYLTLITKDYNYEIQQAPGAEFTVSFGGISEEPIDFTVTGLVIRPAGLSLEARVSQAPVRLKGIGTKFTFSNSGFVMQDSRITEFTLAGSGALPRKLVGESSVEIYLRFGERDGGLSLLDGTAVLRGNKLLKCKDTRFEFSVEKIGIGFVQEGQFHLYFTLTGRAQFRLSDGDDRQGLLALLPDITLEMVDCPLAADVKVLAKHIRFLIVLPKPLSFSLLGCFEMELRGFGFLPQAEMFDGEDAMWLSGQVKFADGAGDSKNDETDYHSLYIGLPEPGGIFPRIHFEQIVVDVKIADSFQLYAMVKYEDTPTARGFKGEGVLRVAGLPKLEAAFAFLRVREDPSRAWVRAWFIYAQVSELSLVLPVVQIYLREIGFGLGYRYTLTMIKAADEQRDVRKLLKALDQLAASQGELAKQSSWQVDVGGPGDPRFTLVLRAMLSQNSASKPTSLDRAAEKNLASTFLFDAVLAFRSDLTFLITARGWINTNYVDYVDDVSGLRRRPFFFAYILLSAPQKRFLARMGNTPGGYIGDHPPLPPFVKTALESARFRATLLIEPGLFHLDLGWPNQLGWSAKLGPINVSIVGGFIFRISRRDLVIGVSYMARGSMEISGGVSAGIAGVNVYARADVAYGMRYIGVLSFDDPAGRSLFYGAVGFELLIQFSVEFWLNLLFKKIRKRFSFSLAFTAALEFGLDGLSPGVRGHGTLALKVCGRSFRVGISIAANEGAVAAAQRRTAEYLKLGLDADDTGGPPEPVPGTTPAALTAGDALVERAGLLEAQTLRRVAPFALALDAIPALAAPHYSAFVVREAHASHDGWSYLVIFPRGARLPDADAEGAPQRGFLPLPSAGGDDFTLDPRGLPVGFTIDRGHVGDDGRLAWEAPGANGTFAWRANWDAVVPFDVDDDPQTDDAIKVGELVTSAFVEDGGVWRDPDDPGELAQEALEDQRVYNPSDSDFEAAVRGAFEQFQGSPFFKHDRNLAYDRALEDAFQPTTTIYSPQGQLPGQGGSDPSSDPSSQESAVGAQQHADQLRGVIVNGIVADVRAYAEAATDERRDTIAGRSPAFQLGLVFRFRAAGAGPAWLTSGETSAVERPAISQRMPGGMGPARKLWIFNPPQTSFHAYPPTFSRVRHYTNAGTVAIAWDLTWEQPPAGCDAEQADPEHHLAYYRVLRRSLDSNERDVVRAVKSAEVLHRAPGTGDAGDTLKLLRPRFQVVDHFAGETPAEQAALPATGRSYLYSITPIDNAGKPGRPLTLVATRFPDRAPRVPTDARLRVRYRLAAATLDDPPAPRLDMPELLAPTGIALEWSEPPPTQDENRVPIKRYRLIFRRSAAMPVGSYGLDSTTQRSAATLIGSAVARPLPTDLIVDVSDPEVEGDIRLATLDLAALRQAGVFPTGANARWRPDTWDVFIQTIALNDVPSSLAPAQIVLEVERAEAAELLPAERQPAELEWLPAPLDLPLLPPEDQRAVVGDAHFPMPALREQDGELSATFDGTLASIGYRRHPAGIRCVRVRWNQGPSDRPGYPLDLTAGFFLLELDVDAATTATFANRRRLAEALRTLQEVRMVPADDLPFIPSTTLEPSQWEAWYPSAIQRRVDDPAQRAPGSQIPSTPWYSWRESLLEWPSPDVDGEPAWRSGDLHPLLQRIVDRLDGVLFRAPAGTDEFLALDKGTVPASLPFAANFIPLTAKARARVVSQGFEWRIEDPANDTELYRFEGQAVLARLLRVVRSETGVVVTVASPFVVDRQELVPAQQGNLTDFLDATAPKGDPYGWGVLQAFGLSTALALRGAGDAKPLLGQALLDALQAAIDACFKLTRFADFRPHLFVELLFQPGRSVELDELGATADGLLANVQISLRPLIRQQRPYAALSVGGAPNTVVGLAFELADHQTLDVINLDERAAGQQSIASATAVGTLDITIPASGTARLSLRSGFTLLAQDRPPVMPSVGFAIGATGVTLAGDLAARFEVKKINTTFYVFLKPGMPVGAGARAALFAQLAALLQPLGVALPFADLTGPLVFAPTAEPAADFTAPQEALAELFADQGDDAGRQWQRFKRYVDSVFTSAPTRIVAPTAPSDIQRILPAFLGWSQRFFDAAGTVNFGAGDIVGRYGAGPWPATAYPRAGAPAYATPDTAGRLTYNHLLHDKWAHAFRYYLKPYSRYARLMAALRDALEPADALRTTTPLVAEPDPAAGGLDIVIERTQPVAAPLVLFSGRLDGDGAPDQPAPPGPTWEVIVAQHPEQALSERNQTLRRRLSFRQVAFTLLRRFADTAWLAWLEEHHAGLEDAPPLYRYVENITQPIPTEYPALPDHLDLAALRGEGDGLSEAQRAARDAARSSLDLPRRLGRFQQGALVLQWDGLPFYYEHRLLLIAQADSVVSPVRELTQRDFEYRTPLPSASAAGGSVAWPPDAPFQPDAPPDIRGRHATIALGRFWDSLPASAQTQWAGEHPGEAPYGPDRPFASLPDHEVVYQVVELFGGNVEVQAELFFGPKTDDPDGRPAYQRRQLGRRVLADEPRFVALQDAQGDYQLAVRLAQFAELPLSQPYALPDGLAAVASRDSVLLIAGPLTARDRNALLPAITKPEDRAAVEDLFQSWYSREPLSKLRSPANGPQGIPAPARDVLARLLRDGLVDFPPAAELALVWSGPLSAGERAAILALDGDDDFKAALARLVGRVTAAQEGLLVSEAVNLAPSQKLAGAPAQLRFIAGPGGTIDAITWTGLITPEQRAALPGLTEDLDLRAALRRLGAAAQAAQDALTTRDAAPRGLDQPPAEPLLARLTIAYDQGRRRATGLSWTGTLHDDEKALIEPALREWSQLAAFRSAIDQLFAALDGRTATGSGRMRPAQADLPVELRGSVQISATALRWSGDPPSAEQQAAAAALVADEGFTTALRTLLAQMQSPGNLVASFTLPEGAALPAIPTELTGRLTFEGSGTQRTLRWNGPLPTADQQAALDTLRAEPLIGGAVTVLLARIDQRRVVALPAAPTLDDLAARPEFVTLDGLLAMATDGGTITFTWAGRAKTSAQTAALATLRDFLGGLPEYRALTPAVQRIIDTLAQPVVVPLDLPARPTQAELPASIRDRLLLGRFVIRYHGLMTFEEGQALTWLYANLPATPASVLTSGMRTADTRSIQRLYDATLGKGMRGRELKIRARRANAAPSPLRSFEASPLIPPDINVRSRGEE